MKPALSPSEQKKVVREGYTEALHRSLDPARAGEAPGGCCASATTAAGGDRRRALEKRLGYASADLERLPDGAVAGAFGCGNPVAFADVQPGQVVLDIGSGAGIDCLIAASRVGPEGRVIGLDMTPAMIEKARENAIAAGATNVEFRLGDAESMPVGDRSVDWVISNCVINLAPDKQRVFAEIARVMKPGGRVAVTDIVLAGNLPDEVVRSVDALVGCVAGAIQETDYVEAMKAAGLADVEVTARTPYELQLGEDPAAGTDSSCGCGCGDTGTGVPETHRHALAGKIRSARFTARKT